MDKEKATNRHHVKSRAAVYVRARLNMYSEERTRVLPAPAVEVKLAQIQRAAFGLSGRDGASVMNDVKRPWISPRYASAENL